MPDISRLVIEVDSNGVVKATGDLKAFEGIAGKAGKGADDLANKFGAFQLVANKLPGPLKSVASGLLGMVSPATAAVSAIMEVASAQIQLSKESEEAYIQQEESLARLGAVLQSTGAQTWTTTEELRNMANTLRRETGRSADEIMQMQSVLLGFTGITGENFERLVGNMINMSDVMGGSLASSANIFGKALENPADSLNALTRQGFVFTEEQKRMVRTLEEAGQLQEAQVIYLEAMEKAFGDAATATREAKREIIDYKQALEDLKLARGEFEASGGMTWERFWREFRQPGIEDQTQRYREATQRRNEERYYEELNKRADEAAINYLQSIKTAEELIAVIESGQADMDALYRAVGLKANKAFNIFRDTGSNNFEVYNEFEHWNMASKALQDYIENYERLQKEKQAELNRLLGIQKELDTERTRIENAYDDTGEGKATKLDRKIAEWIRLRDSMWETATGVFDPLGDEHKRQIDVIIANLKNQKEMADKVKEEFAGWVELLARATGYTKEQVQAMKGLGTIEKYADEVNRLVGYMNNMPTLYDALGLDEVGVLEDAADKLRSVLSAMVGSGMWDGSEDSFKLLMQRLEQSETEGSDARYRKLIESLDAQKELAGMSPENQVAINTANKLKEDGIQPDAGRVLEVMTKNGEIYIKELAKQLEDAGKSTYELAVKRLVLEQGITKEAAEQALKAQKQIDYITSGYDWMGEIAASIDDALRSIRSGGGGYGQYAGARLAQSGMQLVEGSDVGNFIQGFQEGGIWGAIIETLIGALVKVIGGMEEMEKAMSPVTELLSRLEGVINFLHDIITQVFDELVDALKPLLALFGEILQAVKPLVSEALRTVTGALKDILSAAMPLIAIVKMTAPIFEKLAQSVRAVFDALRWFADKMTGGLISQMNEWADTIQLLDDEQQEEAERLKAVNEQYKNLFAALKEQEEYYLQQRRHLNAEWAIENFQRPMPVGDMILSPHGAFSTDPKDYIIATRHPETLAGGGAAPVNIYVINNANTTVSAQESIGENGARVVEITIDRVVQNGLASGKYNDALDAASSRRAGKRVAV